MMKDITIEQYKKHCIEASQYITEIKDEKKQLQADNKRCKDLIKELLESAEYWSEYDVPIGIVDRMREAVKEDKK